MYTFELDEREADVIRRCLDYQLNHLPDFRDSYTATQPLARFAIDLAVAEILTIREKMFGKYEASK